MQLDDLGGLALFVAIGTAISGVGYAIDKLLLPSQRRRLSDILTLWWCRIDDLRPRNAIPMMASMYIVFCSRIFGTTSPRVLAITVLLSFSATTACLLGGDYLWYKSFPRALERWSEHQPVKLYPLNLFADGLVLGTTFLTMRLLRAARPIWQLPLVLMNMAIALCTAYAVFYVGQALEFPETATWDGDDFRRTLGLYLGYLNHFGWFNQILASGRWLGDSYTPSGGEWYAIFYATTIILPTIMYLGMALLIVLSWAAFYLGRSILMQLFRLHVETDKSIFYYSGVLVGLLVIVAKGVHAFATNL